MKLEKKTFNLFPSNTRGAFIREDPFSSNKYDISNQCLEMECHKTVTGIPFVDSANCTFGFTLK